MEVENWETYDFADDSANHYGPSDHHSLCDHAPEYCRVETESDRTEKEDPQLIVSLATVEKAHTARNKEAPRFLLGDLLDISRAIFICSLGSSRFGMNTIFGE